MRDARVSTWILLSATFATAVVLVVSTAFLPAPTSAVAQSATPSPKPAVFDPSRPGSATTKPSIPTPANVAGGVYTNGLAGPEPFPVGVCPTEKAMGENVGEGYKMTVRGRCLPEFATADVAVPATGVSLWDGDVALDFKVVAGAERAGLALFARYVDRAGIGTRIRPGTGEIVIFKRAGGTSTTLASRTDPAVFPDQSDWQRLALRLRGGEVWVLVNDKPVLYASDILDQNGAIMLQVLRDGDVDDEAEVAVVFRDLTLSTVDGSTPERGPVHDES